MLAPLFAYMDWSRCRASAGIFDFGRMGDRQTWMQIRFNLEKSRKPIMRRTFLLLAISATFAIADVPLLSFEDGSASFVGSWLNHNNSSSVALSVDSASPISGKGSARIDYTLNPHGAGNEYPWAGPGIYLGGVYDLRKATGVHLKIRSSNDYRLLDINFFSNWYPVIGYNYGAVYEWTFEIHAGDLDTVLEFGKCDFAGWAGSTRGALAAQVPALRDINQGVLGLVIQVRSGDLPGPSDSIQSGTVLVDEISLLGIDSLETGSVPVSHSLRDLDSPSTTGFPDSVHGTWHDANSNSAMVVSRDTTKTGMGGTSIRCDYALVRDPQSPRTAFAHCGVGFDGDSVFDLSRIQRLEFLYASTNYSQPMFIYPTSRLYSQELLDSGIVYGWERRLPRGTDWCPGQILYKDSLRLPTWAKSHPRLTALVPPIDSILKSAAGIGFSPQPVWTNDTTITSSSAKGAFWVNHLVTVGSQPWTRPGGTNLKGGNPRRSKPEIKVSGRTLYNEGLATLDLYSLTGKLEFRVPPQTHRSLRSGSYLVRQQAASRLLFIP